MVNWKKTITRTVGTLVPLAVGYGIYKYATGNTSSKPSDTSNNNSSSGGSSSGGGSGTGSSSSSSSSSGSKKKTVETPKIDAETVELEKPEEIYVLQANASLQRAGLEVYTTDEEKFEPYVSPINENSTSAGKTSEETAGEEEEIDMTTDESTNKEEEDKSGYSLHQGSILDIYYFGGLQSLSFEGDYKEMSNNGSFNKSEIDEKKFYKGVRLQLFSNWTHRDIPITWFDMESCIEGFITEQTFKEENIEVKISGMSKLLEKKVLFKCTEQKRSAILQELIKTAGLIPMINIDGLEDDVTDFSNITEGKNNSNANIKSTGSASIDEAVKKAISGKTGCLEKAKAIDKAFKSHVYYKWYLNVHHPNLDEAWKNGHLNCADGANVLSAMFRSAGIKAIIRYTSGHYIVKVTCNGKDYFTDCSASTGYHPNKPFGTVYGGTAGTDKGVKLDY